VSSEKFTVGLVQMSCGSNPEENFAKALSRVADAAKTAQVVCLPELFQTQYFCQRRTSPVRSGGLFRDHTESSRSPRRSWCRAGSIAFEKRNWASITTPRHL
jgi:predicted amidohydrolase